jgi:hypothetical protein
MTTEKLDVHLLKDELPNLVDRLAHESVEFELIEGGKVVARLIPPSIEEGLSTQEFVELLESLPPLGDDAATFWNDVQEVRNAYLPETDPWACS